jgi:hypothetical protein
VGASYPVSVSQPNGAWLSSLQVGVTAVHGTASPYAHTPPMRLAGFLSEAPTSGETQTRGTSLNVTLLVLADASRSAAGHLAAVNGPACSI